jgi:hypothetical protein
VPQGKSIEPVTAYRSKGFARIRGLFEEPELAQLHEVLSRFHSRWQEANAQFYEARAVNSACLTDPDHLSPEDRRVLFRLLGDRRIERILSAIFAGPVAFMNTQLFFNPANPEQPNYWHRDIQYSGAPEAVQREELKHTNVLHLRLALMPERGIELVPGSHKRWDTDEEYAVRMAQGQSKVSDELRNAECVPMERGDLLVFSANMLHRGLYGGNRFAFDMLFCDPLERLVKYVRPSCLPHGEDFDVIANPAPFLETLRVRKEAGL